MRVYVAGPMSGLPELNYPAFHAAAAQLRAAGFEVDNPAENPAPPCGTWLGYMRMSLTQIASADALVMLPGWIWSRGARIEWLIATLLGFPVLSIKSLSLAPSGAADVKPRNKHASVPSRERQSNGAGVVGQGRHSHKGEAA